MTITVQARVGRPSCHLEPIPHPQYAGRLVQLHTYYRGSETDHIYSGQALAIAVWYRMQEVRG